MFIRSFHSFIVAKGYSSIFHFLFFAKQVDPNSEFLYPRLCINKPPKSALLFSTAWPVGARQHFSAFVLGGRLAPSPLQHSCRDVCYKHLASGALPTRFLLACKTKFIPRYLRCINRAKLVEPIIFALLRMGFDRFEVPTIKQLCAIF